MAHSTLWVQQPVSTAIMSHYWISWAFLVFGSLYFFIFILQVSSIFVSMDLTWSKWTLRVSVKEIHSMSHFNAIYCSVWYIVYGVGYTKDPVGEDQVSFWCSLWSRTLNGCSGVNSESSIQFSPTECGPEPSCFYTPAHISLCVYLRVIVSLRIWSWLLMDWFRPLPRYSNCDRRSPFHQRVSEPLRTLLCQCPLNPLLHYGHVDSTIFISAARLNKTS